MLPYDKLLIPIETNCIIEDREQTAIISELSASFLKWTEGLFDAVSFEFEINVPIGTTPTEFAKKLEDEVTGFYYDIEEDDGEYGCDWLSCWQIISPTEVKALTNAIKAFAKANNTRMDIYSPKLQ
jgi:hypothetical protein